MNAIEMHSLVDACDQACTQAVLELRLNNIDKLQRTDYMHRINTLRELMQQCNAVERAQVLKKINHICATYELRDEKKTRLMEDLKFDA